MVGGIAGMRWVTYVRVDDSGPEPRYVAVGIGNRLPAEVPIARATAARLVGAVPFLGWGRRQQGD